MLLNCARGIRGNYATCLAICTRFDRSKTTPRGRALQVVEIRGVAHMSFSRITFGKAALVNRAEAFVNLVTRGSVQFGGGGGGGDGGRWCNRQTATRAYIGEHVIVARGNGPRRANGLAGVL